MNGIGVSVSFPSGSVYGQSAQYSQMCLNEANPAPQICGGELGGGGSCSPIILDVAGRGYEMTSGDDGVVFDIKGDGHPIQISWTARGSRNAWLALDRNGNGKIDSGRELFGNYTEQPPSPDPNGYLALAEFDKPENGGNGDGIIDYRDAVYSKLLLWIDENHDGISQPNELHHLRDLGVYSLSLKYTDSTYTDAFGNRFHYKGKVNVLGEPTGDHIDRTDYDVFVVGAVSTVAKSVTEAKSFDEAGHR